MVLLNQAPLVLLNKETKILKKIKIDCLVLQNYELEMNYELKHIHGIPYFLNGATIYTFELDSGKPSSKCVPSGTYNGTTDTISYFPEWRELVQSNLNAFRGGLAAQEREKLRDSIVKPQKPRKAQRTPRKPSSRTKSAKSE